MTSFWDIVFHTLLPVWPQHPWDSSCGMVWHTSKFMIFISLITFLILCSSLLLNVFVLWKAYPMCSPRSWVLQQQPWELPIMGYRLWHFGRLSWFLPVCTLCPPIRKFQHWLKLGAWGRQAERRRLLDCNPVLFFFTELSLPLVPGGLSEWVWSEVNTQWHTMQSTQRSLRPSFPKLCKKSQGRFPLSWRTSCWGSE